MNSLVKDLFHLVFEMVGFVNTFWGIYATVTIALLGWLFSSKYVWPWQQKIAITVAYALVVGVNCAAQYRFNILLRAAARDLKSAIEANPALIPALRDAVQTFPLLPEEVLIGILVLVDLVVICLIWNQHRFHQSPKSVYANED